MLKILGMITNEELKKLLYIYEESNNEFLKKNYINKYSSEIEAQNTLISDYNKFLKEFQSDQKRYICVWEEQGVYRSGLRLINLGNGIWFLEALETSPNDRNNGYGKLLLNSIIEYLKTYDAKKLECLIGSTNIASQRTHESCGFIRTNLSPIDWDGAICKTAIKYIYFFKNMSI